MISVSATGTADLRCTRQLRRARHRRSRGTGTVSFVSLVTSLSPGIDCGTRTQPRAATIVNTLMLSANTTKKPAPRFIPDRMASIRDDNCFAPESASGEARLRDESLSYGGDSEDARPSPTPAAPSRSW